MFISKEHLHYNLGVDLDIATFFVDRKVPVSNRYWKGRFLYVSRGTGYLFIPLFFDLQFRCGVSRENLLQEEYIQLMEDILHSAAMYEFEHINFDEHIANCKMIMQNKINNDGLYTDLLAYFSHKDLRPYKNLGTISTALNRGDTFLFSLCHLALPRPLTDKIIEDWYALVPSFLLMDDITDLQEDGKNNQENSISDFGNGQPGIEKAIQFLWEKINKLTMVNEKLGLYFEKSLKERLETPYLKSILNN